MKTRMFATTLLCSLILAACGGGGGTSGSTHTVQGSSLADGSTAPQGKLVVKENLAPIEETYTPLAGNEVGIGLYDFTYFDQSFAMADLARHAELRQYDTWAAANVDQSGAPTADFKLLYSALSIGPGTYKLQFTGQASVSPATNVRYDPSTNTTTADVVLASTQFGNKWLTFSNTRRTPTSTSSDGVTNIRMWRPGYPTDGSAVFTTEFISVMKRFHVIRTMDLTKTNTNPTQTWEERTRPDYIGIPGQKGQSWELIVMLANATQRDVWINIPVRANDEYIIKLARLFKYGSDGIEPYSQPTKNAKYPPLNSNLKVYVEYGNEVWNTGPGFMGFYWARDQADQYRLNTSHPIAFDGAVTDQYTGVKRWIAYRSAYASKVFRDVFGDSAMMTRIRPILGSQVANANNYLSDGLLWAEAFYGNTASLWYGGGGAEYFDSEVKPTDATPSTMQAYFDGLPNSSFSKKVATDAIWTKGFGLKTVAYEGGPEPGGTALGGTTGLTDDQIYSYNNDPRMKERMAAAYQKWQENGGDLFMFYVYNGAAPWSFLSSPKTSTTADANSNKIQAVDQIRTMAPVTPRLGIQSPGTIALRAPEALTIDRATGSTLWGYNGTAYRVRAGAIDPGSGKPFNEFLLVPTHTTSAGNYEVSVSTYDTSESNSIEVSANGKILGEIKPTKGASGVATKSQPLTVTLPSGITVFRLRAKVGTIWIKDLVIEQKSAL